MDTAIIWVRDDGGLDQGGGDGEKGQDSGYILKVELKGCVNPIGCSVREKKGKNGFGDNKQRNYFRKGSHKENCSEETFS